MGDGSDIDGKLEDDEPPTLTRGRASTSGSAPGPTVTVDTLAVDEPETDDGGEDASGFSISSIGEYNW